MPDYTAMLEGIRAEKAFRITQAGRKVAAEESLMEFVRLFWPVVEPSTRLVEGWTLELICDALEAVADGHQTRMVINVPPGFMKPNSVDGMILTRRGRIRLGDVVVGDEVLTHRGRYRGVTAVHEQGILPLLRITTENGRTNLTAADHPYLTTRGWIEAQHLTDQDVVAAVVPQQEGMRELVTPEEARLLGYLVGDGSCTGYATFTNADEEILEDFRRCAASCGFSTSDRATPPSKPVGYKAKIIAIRGAVQWLRGHGLEGSSSYTKRIPPRVLASSREIIANFIGAYWSCDGQIVVRHIRERGSIYVSNATTVALELAGDIQHALLRLGINARIRTRVRSLETARQPGGRYIYYHVQTCAHEDTVLFKGMPGLCRAKASLLDGLQPRRFTQGPLFEDDVVLVEPAGEGPCRCLSVDEDESFTSNDIAVHNSSMLNVFFPAWEWGPRNMPHLRYLSCSYSADVPERDNERLLKLITSPLYQRLWGDRFTLTGTGVQMLRTDKTGWKRVAPLVGTAGWRGDRLLLDDLNDPFQTESADIRDKINRWLTETASDRINSVDSAIVLIQQRTHENDATDTLARRGTGYTWIVVPMEFDPYRALPVTLRYLDDGEADPDWIWRDPRSLDEAGRPLRGWATDRNGKSIIRPGSPLAMAEGELAWPERFDREFVEAQKLIKGPYAWAGQYSQSPSPRGGGIIRRDWWRPWLDEEGTPAKQFPEFGTVIVSVDTSLGMKQENDYNAVTKWGAFSWGDDGAPQLMLIAAWRARMPLADLVLRVNTTCNERPAADYLVIENKTRGQDLRDEIAREYGTQSFGIELMDPVGDKVSRMHAASPMFSGDRIRKPVPNTLPVEYIESYSGGMIWAPETDWAEEVIEEVTAFPRATHDDYADSVSQAVIWVRRNGVVVRKTEWTDSETEARRYKKPQRVPYAI